MDDLGAHDDELPSELLPLVEPLAAEVHAAWARAKRAQGFTLGEPEGGRMRHPDLVDWDILPEETKDLDRATVRAVLIGVWRRGYRAP